MTRIRVIVFLFLTFFFGNIKCQDASDSTRISMAVPAYSQYLQNGLVINPAYAGSRGALSSFLWYRMQWMGITGAPSMQSVSLHTPLKNDKVALGLTAQFMQYGFNKSSSVYASYAYNIRIWKGRLSFGLKGGADFMKTVYPDENFLTNPGDPVFASDESYALPNMGAGVYYYNEKFFGGFSVPSFLSYRRTGTGTVESFHSFSNYELMFTGGALFAISDQLKFKPSFLVDYSLQDTKKLKRMDLSGNLILSDLFWFGASWRTTEKVIVGILQFQITQQLMLGLSYDYPAGQMNLYSKGSSEFILRYEFGSKVSAANPRYF
jgi:type IX secretion system PorP/SprF family membrane protein